LKVRNLQQARIVRLKNNLLHGKILIQTKKTLVKPGLRKS